MFFADGDWFQILAALIFFAITGLAQWLQKRSQARRGLGRMPEPDTFPAPPVEPGRGTPPPVGEVRRLAETNWEEQLRRILEGNRPEPDRTPPPPVLAIPPSLPDESAQAESAESFSWEDQPASARELDPLREAKAAHDRATGIDEAADHRLTAAARMASASAAYAQASNLHENVAQRLRAARVRTESSSATPPSVHLRRRSAEASTVIDLFRRPESARQAVLASVVLQPPKALE